MGCSRTRALTDSSGTVTDRYAYDAYGNLIASFGNTENSYRFAGEQFDKNLGQYYLRDRYYGTDIGRFTRSDNYQGNTSNPPSLNKYLYGSGNPINFTDPTGFFSIIGVLATLTLLDKLIIGSAILGIGAGIAYSLSSNSNSDYYPSGYGSDGINAIQALSADVEGEIKVKSNGWTKEQCAEAKQKIDDLNNNAQQDKLNAYIKYDGKLRTNKRLGNNTSRYTSAGEPNGKLNAGQQVDHIIDVQFREGKDVTSNMRPLDSKVNQSIGKQIERALKKLAQGKTKAKIKVTKITLEGC